MISPNFASSDDDEYQFEVENATVQMLKQYYEENRGSIQQNHEHDVAEGKDMVSV
jgi:hypothetical protein